MKLKKLFTVASSVGLFFTVVAVLKNYQMNDNVDSGIILGNIEALSEGEGGPEYCTYGKIYYDEKANIIACGGQGILCCF